MVFEEKSLFSEKILKNLDSRINLNSIYLTFPVMVGVVSDNIFLIASTFSCRRFFSSGDNSGACSGIYLQKINKRNKY